MPPKARVGLLDVARLAGVSAKTVSRVVNGEPGVSSRKREEIEAAIRHLGFRPNQAARALKGNSTRTIMLLTTNIESFYVGETIKGAAKGCREAELHLVIEEYDGNSSGQLERLRKSLEYAPVDGVIIPPPWCDDSRLLALFEEQGIAAVLISPAIRPERGVRVSAREDLGAAAVASHFWELGHRHVAVLTGMKDHVASRLRFEGFLSGWKAAGGNIRDVRQYSYEDMARLVQRDSPAEGKSLPLSLVDIGVASARSILSGPDRPSAIFAFNDSLAVGLMWGAVELGLTIPGDVSIAGFDGNVAASLVRPRLTTVYQPVREMAEEAVRLLAAKTAQREDREFDVSFRTGGTTGPLDRAGH